MWKLKAPTSELITWYKNTMLDGLYLRIKQRDNGDPVLEQKIQDVLIPKVEDGSDDKSILEHLLLYKPQESHELCNNLMGQIISNYDENEFPLYLEAKNKGNYRDAAQETLFQKYFGTLKKYLIYLITTGNYPEINHAHTSYPWGKAVTLVHIVIANTLSLLMEKMIRNESHVHN